MKKKYYLSDYLLHVEPQKEITTKMFFLTTSFSSDIAKLRARSVPPVRAPTGSLWKALQAVLGQTTNDAAWFLGA